MVKLKIEDNLATITYTKFVKVDNVRVDDFVFRLHYNVSPIIILLFVAAYAINEYIHPAVCIFDTGCNLGPHWVKDEVIWREKLDPISEVCDEEDFIVSNALQDYCWTVEEGMHTYPDMVQNKSGFISTYPGVGHPEETDYKSKHHSYYQWLPGIFLMQFMLFNLPRSVWSRIEDGRMKTLTGELVKCILKPKDRIKFQKLLSDYLFEQLTSRRNRLYAPLYCLCEGLNLLCVAAQLYAYDRMTGNELSKLGLTAFSVAFVPPRFRVDKVATLFPVLVKCNFTDFGQGAFQVRDGLCILPINAIGEHYFFILWYYLLILAAIDCGQMCYRLITIISSEARTTLLCYASMFTNKRTIKRITKKSSYSEWFILYQLSQNVDSPVYHEVIDEYASRLDRFDMQTKYPQVPLFL